VVVWRGCAEDGEQRHGEQSTHDAGRDEPGGQGEHDGQRVQAHSATEQEGCRTWLSSCMTPTTIASTMIAETAPLVTRATSTATAPATTEPTTGMNAPKNTSVLSGAASGTPRMTRPTTNTHGVHDRHGGGAPDVAGQGGEPAAPGEVHPVTYPARHGAQQERPDLVPLGQ
jgi:hypothetical protein